MTAPVFFLLTPGAPSSPAQPADHLAMVTQPSSTAVNGVVFAQQPAVRLKDVSNANVSQLGITITALIFSGTGAFIGASTANTDASGIATFATLGLTGLVGSFVLQFTSGSLTPVTSSAITLSVGAAAQLAVLQSPSSVVVTGLPFPRQPWIAILDSGGNLVTSATNTVTVSLFAGPSSLVGTLAVAAVAGITKYTDLELDGVGDNVLHFTATSLTEQFALVTVVLTLSGSSGGGPDNWLPIVKGRAARRKEPR